jgi:hypothetical protein
MPIHSRGMALLKDLQYVFGALGLGSDQDEFALVMERRDVSVDHIFRQVTIGKVGPKCTDRYGQVRFNTSRILRRNYARRKERTDRDWTDRTYIARVIRHDSFIVNSAFKSRGNQSFVSSVQIPGVVEDPNNDGF